MHRTQIYLDDGLHSSLKGRAREAGVSMSELIRRALQSHVQRSPAADAQAFFQRLQPLESFAQIEAADHVRALRQRSRLLRAAAKGEADTPV
jgi:negative regulator of replication initiation